jgi:hypothetical protein
MKITNLEDVENQAKELILFAEQNDHSAFIMFVEKRSESIYSNMIGTQPDLLNGLIHLMNTETDFLDLIYTTVKTWQQDKISMN